MYPNIVSHPLRILLLRDYMCIFLVTVPVCSCKISDTLLFNSIPKHTHYSRERASLRGLNPKQHTKFLSFVLETNTQVEPSRLTLEGVFRINTSVIFLFMLQKEIARSSTGYGDALMMEPALFHSHLA